MRRQKLMKESDIPFIFPFCLLCAAMVAIQCVEVIAFAGVNQLFILPRRTAMKNLLLAAVVLTTLSAGRAVADEPKKEDVDKAQGKVKEFIAALENGKEG